MQILLTSFSIALLSLHCVTFASQFSTKWTIRNNSKNALTITCKNASTQGVIISMTSKSIGSNKYEVYDWGDDYYNDGLWLNAGKWACKAKNSTSFKNELESFSTDWGESITLLVDDSKGYLKLTKVEKDDATNEKEDLKLTKTKKDDTSDEKDDVKLTKIEKDDSTPLPKNEEKK